MLEYFQKTAISVTVSDKNGKILEMSDKAVATFCKDGQSIIGNSLFDCHPEPARTKLLAMFENHNINAYTIEKNRVKKLIYQVPWFEGEEFAGYIELSMEIPFEMPHYVRMPKK